MIEGLHSDDAFMKEALKQAQYALEEGEIPVGAIIVCDNKIIARAYNQVERLGDVTAHAEILAITAAENYLGAKYLTQCRLFVTLEPCVMCIGATYWAQLQEIVYAASDKKRGFATKSPNAIHPKVKIKKDVLAAESERLLKSFFQKLRN